MHGDRTYHSPLRRALILFESADEEAQGGGSAKLDQDAPSTRRIARSEPDPGRLEAARESSASPTRAGRGSGGRGSRLRTVCSQQDPDLRGTGGLQRKALSSGELQHGRAAGDYRIAQSAP